MTFSVSIAFADSLARLSADEQKLAKTTAFDLQLNPANPGHQFHKLERAKDKRFWSIRVSSDLRIIVHRTDDLLIICFVGHHDQAYAWAERRKIEAHPVTGALQLVELRETVREIEVKNFVTTPTVAPAFRPFVQFEPAQILSWGVPEDWVDTVRNATEDEFLAFNGRLPAEASEILLDVAAGNPAPVPQGAKPVEPLAHPDTQRRFQVFTSSTELQKALDSPWDQWIVYLHPDQRDWVERSFGGPARVSGSAGTGKTIVALHRAVHLARLRDDARVLLTTFTAALAQNLRLRLRKLLAGEPRLTERIDVEPILTVALRLSRRTNQTYGTIDDDELALWLQSAAAGTPASRFTTSFLQAEWDEIIEGWDLQSWDEYRDVTRLGRKTRLPETVRKELWTVFESVRARLADEAKMTRAGLFNRLRLSLAGQVPYQHIVVDEAQDLSLPQLRLLASWGAAVPNRLFFAGDLAQRIFQSPFSWKSVGVDVRGRSKTLRVNYRTSHQIRSQADRLLAPEVIDVDGLTEVRNRTVSVFQGPEPAIRAHESAEAETDAVVQWLQRLRDEGLALSETALVVRSEAQLPRIIGMATVAGLPYLILDDELQPKNGHLNLLTMPVAKGLEFRAVAVVSCNDDVIPSPDRLEAAADEAELQTIFDTERNLLYVACTRARDHLLVTSAGNPSEFLADFAFSD